MYDAVLTLLVDLQIQSHVILAKDDHSCAVVEKLCQHFAQLEITGKKLSQNGSSDLTAFYAFSTSKEFVLASLTTSDREASIADLATHLLLLLGLQNPQTASTPTAPVNQPPLQADHKVQDNNISGSKTAFDGSLWATTTAQQCGVTYPSELLDDTSLVVWH